MSLQIYTKYNWQRVSDELAICTACVKGCRVGPRGLQHVLHHYALRVPGAGTAEIILADFNSAVSTPTAKPPNLNPCKIFRLYGITLLDSGTQKWMLRNTVWLGTLPHGGVALWTLAQTKFISGHNAQVIHTLSGHNAKIHTCMDTI